MDVKKLFYQWAATYGDSKEDANRSLYGKDLMIEFAEMAVKESHSLPSAADRSEDLLCAYCKEKPTHENYSLCKDCIDAYNKEKEITFT